MQISQVPIPRHPSDHRQSQTTSIQSSEGQIPSLTIPDTYSGREPSADPNARASHYAASSNDSGTNPHSQQNNWAELTVSPNITNTTPASGLTRSNSEESLASVDSFFGHRPGISNPPDTLSTQITKVDALEAGAFLFLVEQAAAKSFNVHANATNNTVCLNFVTDKLVENGFHCFSIKSEGVKVFQHADNGAFVTICTDTDLPSHMLPSWSEDVLFMGNHNAHVLEEEFTREFSVADLKEIRREIHTRRKDAWITLGISEPLAHSINMSTGNRYHYDARKSANGPDFDIPNTTHVLSARTERPREIVKTSSIAASIEGGNYLSNGAKRGERVHIIGLDSVSATRFLMEQKAASISTTRGPAPSVTFLEAQNQIKDQLYLNSSDKVVFVEQPSFHIDMSMLFVGPNEVVLSDTTQFVQLVESELTEESINKAKLEGSVARTLEENEITVHRKPWASPSASSMSCFNGEFVACSNADKRVLFLTNSAFGIDDVHKNAIHADIISFFRDREIDVVFAPEYESREWLTNGGGIGCKTNMLHS